MKKTLKERGIDIATFSVYNPKSHRLRERTKRILMEQRRTVQLKDCMKKFWYGEALLHAEVLHNRMVSYTSNCRHCTIYCIVVPQS